MILLIDRTFTSKNKFLIWPSCLQVINTFNKILDFRNLRAATNQLPATNRQ